MRSRSKCIERDGRGGWRLISPFGQDDDGGLSLESAAEDVGKLGAFVANPFAATAGTVAQLATTATAGKMSPAPRPVPGGFLPASAPAPQAAVPVAVQVAMAQAAAAQAAIQQEKAQAHAAQLLAPADKAAADLTAESQATATRNGLLLGGGVIALLLGVLYAAMGGRRPLIRIAAPRVATAPKAASQ